MKKLLLELPEGMETQVITSDGSVLEQVAKDMQLISEGKASLILESMDEEGGNAHMYVQVHVGPKVVN